MTTFTVHIYNPDQWMYQVELVRDDTEKVISSHYGPGGLSHERALEIAREEVRLHTSTDGEKVPQIEDHWDEGWGTPWGAIHGD